MAAAGDTKDTPLATAITVERNYQSSHSAADIAARYDTKCGKVAKARNALIRAQKALDTAIAEQSACETVSAELNDSKSRAKIKRKKLEAELAKLPAPSPTAADPIPIESNKRAKPTPIVVATPVSSLAAALTTLKHT
jgi:hypothetical protein